MTQDRSFQDHDYDFPEEQQTHWREYVRVLWEWKWITITAVVIGATLGLIQNFKAVPVYQATTPVELDADTPRIVNFQDVAATDTRSSDYLNTKVQVLRSRSLAEKVVKTLALNGNPDFLPGAGTGADFAGALQGCVSAQLRRGTRIIDITAEHTNPKMAALIANGVAQEFVKLNSENRLSASMDAIRWLSDQSEQYKAQLAKSEAAVQEYREKTRDVSLEDSYNIVLDKLKSMNTAFGNAKMARMSTETEWKQVQALLDSGRDAALIPAIASDGEVEALHQSLTQKQIAVSALRERYKDQYPAMIVALSEQKEIENKLKQACVAAVEKIKARYAVAKAQEESLVEPLAEQEKQALELSRKLVEYNRLKRNAESDRQLYDSLLVRMKEAGVTGKLEFNNMHIIDPARVPGGPCRPDKKRNLVYAIVMGLLAGLVLSYGAHFYDDKIKTCKDIESYLGMPLLCEVPRIESKSDSDRATIVSTDPLSLASEAFSSLRATIGATPNAKDIKILMVTSTAPGEGKSLVASNMAIAFAHDNLRTLLIDADLRHPTLFKDFQIKTQTVRGLSQYLLDGCKREDVILKSGIPNLDIIIAGKIAKNPAELLGSARMRELIEQERQQYDRIIIDTPPVAVVSDAIVLLPRVQGIIFVTHFRKLRRDAVARAVKKLREMGAPLIGNVLNNIDLKKHGYYYYPYHGSYRYPYYHKEDGRRRTEGEEESES